LENSQVKLKVRIPTEDVRKQYDDILREYTQKAHLKGFRPGKVPADVIVRKLGPALMDQTRSEVLEKSLSEIFESVEQKPIPYATPEIKADEALELGKDYAFEVIYDTWPSIELGPYQGLEIDQPQWDITDEDIGRELKGIQEQNALFADREGGDVQTGNIVNLDYVELEAGSERPETRREAFVFEVGTGYNVYKIDDEVIGMKAGETKTITKIFPEDFETKALAGKTVNLRITLNSIKEKKLPEINDELARDISEKFATIADLRADIAKKLEEAVKQRIRSQTVSRILDSVVETSRIPLPSSLVDYQLENMWHEYVSQMRIEEKKLVEILEAQGTTMESLRKDWLPAAEKRARLQLVVSEIAKRENIAIEEQELEAEISRMADARKVTPAELKESLTRNNLVDYMKSNLRIDKLYDFLLSKTTLRAGEKRKVLDILQGN
ncbi:MAG TPA: trigger factor, partial [Spirochaetia bacterium]|nr:trigger factor [Spirochaetia bacterium]